MSTTPRTDALRDKLLQVIAAWAKGEIYADDLQVAVEFHLKETSAMETQLQQANAQIASLQSWKEQQMAVEKDWNPQELAKMLGGTLGVSCLKIIQEKVPELVGQIAALGDALDGLIKINEEHNDSVSRVVSKLLEKVITERDQAEEVLHELKADAEALADAVVAILTADESDRDVSKAISNARYKLHAFRAKHPQKEDA